VQIEGNERGSPSELRGHRASCTDTLRWGKYNNRRPSLVEISLVSGKVKKGLNLGKIG
jgi:hypothetical protein